MATDSLGLGETTLGASHLVGKSDTDKSTNKLSANKINKIEYELKHKGRSFQHMQTPDSTTPVKLQDLSIFFLVQYIFILIHNNCSS